MIRHAPFYWVECDACATRCPREDDESVAWADADQAEWCAVESGWHFTTQPSGKILAHCPNCVSLAEQMADALDG